MLFRDIEIWLMTLQNRDVIIIWKCLRHHTIVQIWAKQNVHCLYCYLIFFPTFSPTLNSDLLIRLKTNSKLTFNKWDWKIGSVGIETGDISIEVSFSLFQLYTTPNSREHVSVCVLNPPGVVNAYLCKGYFLALFLYYSRFFFVHCFRSNII